MPKTKKVMCKFCSKREERGDASIIQCATCKGYCKCLCSCIVCYVVLNNIMLKFFIQDSLFSSQGELLSMRVLRRRF